MRQSRYCAFCFCVCDCPTHRSLYCQSTCAVSAQREGRQSSLPSHPTAPLHKGARWWFGPLGSPDGSSFSSFILQLRESAYQLPEQTCAGFQIAWVKHRRWRMDITDRCCNGEHSASVACLGHGSGIGSPDNLVFNLVWDFLFFTQLFSQSKQFTVHKSTLVLEAEDRTLAQSADLLARRYAGNIRCTVGIDCYGDVRLYREGSGAGSSTDLFSGRKDDGHIVFQRLTEQVQQQQAADAVVQCLCTDAAAHLNKGRTEGCKVARLSKLQCVLAVFAPMSMYSWS